MGIFRMLFGDLWGLTNRLTPQRKQTIWLEIGKNEPYSEEALHDAIMEYVNSPTNDEEKKKRVARLFNDRH